MKRLSSWTLAFGCVAVMLLAVASPRGTNACAGVGRRGPITVEGEEALIVWDARRHRMHFVRRAAFGANEDFGFLVPTPHRPQLAEVDDEVFDRLFAVYRAPRRRTRRRGARGRGPTAAVRVLERRTVAGLDAAVLAANDAGALDRWLDQHGYQSGDALRQWFAPYVDRGWIITAFRIDPEGATRGVQTRSMRMSFRADQAFFPYSEPQQARATGRPFRVSVIAPYRVSASLNGEPWPRGGAVGFARPLERSRLESLLRGVVPPAVVPRRAWLTVFDEPRSLRGAHDVLFSRSSVQNEVGSGIHTKVTVRRRTPPNAPWEDI